MLISLSIDHQSTDSDDTHTVDVYAAPVSSPPSSSPVTVTPPDCLDEEVDSSENEYQKTYLESHGLERIHEDNSSVHPPTSPFVYRLNSLLVAAQRDRAASLQRSRIVSAQPFYTHGHGLAADSDSGDSPSSKRRHSRVESDGSGSAPGSGAALKKRKLSQRHLSASGNNPAAHASVPRLSGAFRLSFAKGPGSLRRAESLRSELSAVDEEQVLNEVFDDASQGHEARSQRSNALVPQRLPVTLGSIASPFGAYVATVPTTPTANDVQQRLSSTSVPQDLAAVPVLALPPFELLLKPPLNKEHAAECRIVALMLRERNERDEDGLYPVTVARVAEDGQNQSEASSASPTPEGGDAEHWMTVEELQRLNPPSPQPTQESRRATISLSPLELDIDENLFDLTIRWLLEVKPPDDYKTSYLPGDLYDLLSTSSEARFHATYLFLRYLLLVRSSPSSSSVESEDTASISSNDQMALEAVTWDIAVACLALSVKYHRDVLFPLDVIYAHEFIDLAVPHKMTFEDLENAQRDVLEAVAYRIGSATPGAFMEELWAALPTLRTLLGFDAGWEGVQKEAWATLCDASQYVEILQYPISLITACAIIEGIVEVLSVRYKTTGVDGRGKRVRKRDVKSPRKAAMKSSQGVRLDIQELLEISKSDLVACQKWLGLVE